MIRQSLKQFIVKNTLYQILQEEERVWRHGTYIDNLQQHELDPFPPVESDRRDFTSDFSPRVCLEPGAPNLIIIICESAE